MALKITIKLSKKSVSKIGLLIIFILGLISISLFLNTKRAESQEQPQEEIKYENPADTVKGGVDYASANVDPIWKGIEEEQLFQEKYDNDIDIKSKYQLNKLTLVRIVKNDSMDKIEVTIGNKDSQEFIPDIELRRWDEVGFKIKVDNILKGVTAKDKNLTFDRDKIKFDTPEMSFEEYEIPATDTDEGGYEFKCILNKKPITNKVEFQIESSGLDFFYQQPLTEEYESGWLDVFQTNITVNETHVIDKNGNVLVERPEKVVGSYAVYCSKSGNKYQTGKVFHIYRPLITDANKKTIWGNLSIDHNILTIAIDQKWLDLAVYPVIIDPTFGYTKVGGTSDYVLSTIGPPTVYGSKNTGSEGSITTISAYLGCSGYCYNVNACVKGAIYNYPANTTNITGSSVSCYDVYSSSVWANSSLTGNIYSVNYIIATMFNASGSVNPYTRILFYYDSGGTNVSFINTSFVTSGTLDSVSFPSPLKDKVANNRIYSIFASYTPSGDNTPPQFSNNATNGTTAGSAVNFTITITDDTGVSGYIFSTNNSGSWKNSSFVLASGSPVTAWNVTVLNSTTESLIQWKFYANDSSANNNWNVSETYSLTTTSVDTCVPVTNQNWNVDCSDNCVKENGEITLLNITFYGSGTLIFDNYNITMTKRITDVNCKVIRNNFKWVIIR